MTASVRRPPSTSKVRKLPPRLSWSLLPERVTALAGRAVAGGAPSVLTHAPATGAKIVDLPQSSTADIELGFERARRAQREWAARPLAERTAVFQRLHDLVLREQAEILDIIQTETGKARSHAFEEVVDVAINSRYYERTAASVLKPQGRSGALPV